MKLTMKQTGDYDKTIKEGLNVFDTDEFMEVPSDYAKVAKKNWNYRSTDPYAEFGKVKFYKGDIAGVVAVMSCEDNRKKTLYCRGDGDQHGSLLAFLRDLQDDASRRISDYDDAMKYIKERLGPEPKVVPGIGWETPYSIKGEGVNGTAKYLGHFQVTEGTINGVFALMLVDGLRADGYKAKSLTYYI